MSKQFWTFLLVGLAVVGVAVAVLLFSTKGAHLDLQGEILKVRVLALNPNASLVMADFRVTNPSDLNFIVKNVTMWLDPLSGVPLEGTPISKHDMDNVFTYQKLLGPKYNDVLSIKDRIGPRQTVDRMTGVRFELPESGIDFRKDIRLHFEEMDGTVVDLAEKRAARGR